MRLYGLTGGIASGKSTVADLLQGKGAGLIDADRIARDLVLPGTPALAEIAARFPGVLDPTGHLDRQRLASQVFFDPLELRALEAILHPRIRAESVRRAAILAYAGKQIGFYEAALIFEKGIEKEFEGVVLVVAKPKTQLHQLMARDGLTLTEATARVQAQMPVEEKIPRAQFVIDSEASLEELRFQVDALWERLETLSGVASEKSALR